MLTNDELARVAELAEADVRAELVGMWNIEDATIQGTITPGMVRSVLRVLAREYGIKRTGATVETAGEALGRAIERRLAAEVDAADRNRIEFKRVPTPAPQTKGPAAWPADTKPHTNGHAPEKRPANLDAAPTVTVDAPPKRPASLWATRLELGDGPLAARIAQIETGEMSFRQLDKESDRQAVIYAFLRWMKATGRRRTQDEANRVKPDWVPIASSWPTTYGMSWGELVTEAGAE